MGFACTRCGKYFCAKHRLPEMHKCTLKKTYVEPSSIYTTKPDKVVEIKQEESEGQDQFIPIGKNVYRPEFEEEKPERQSEPQTPKLNLMPNLVIFGIFIAFDFMILLLYPQVLGIIPLVIHLLFFPNLFYKAYKQKKTGDYSPSLLKTFVKNYLIYLVVYLVVKIMISFLLLDFFTGFLFIIIGSRIVYTWWRFSTMLKYIPE